MRKVFAFQFMTLDGIAEFPEYPHGPESDPNEPDPMWTPRMPGIDTLFLGRRSYTVWSDFWPKQQRDPTANAWMKEYSRFADRCEKVVFSKSLAKVDWPNSRLVRGPIENEVARLRQQPGGNLAVGGGPRLFQEFLARDLVDELFVKVYPSLVGHGKPMFRLWPDPDSPRDEVPDGAPDRHDFRTVEALKLSDGAVVLHYERVPKRE
jgi:dihydrofolate reductase